MKLPGYAECRDSGVDWLGEIPSHWGIFRLRDIAEVINGFPFDSKLFSAEGAHPLIRIRDLDSTYTDTRYAGELVQSAAVFPGDVLVGMDGNFNVGRWLGGEVALLNQRMCCIRTDSDELKTILRHALPIPLNAINEITYATTVKHLSSIDVQKIRFALPDAAEVAAISAFLDRETTKIDALIAEQEKLLALLAEKHQATISHAVTRGLNPVAPMKDSGVSWLGEVPAHWEVLPTKRLFRVIVDPAPSNNDEELLSIYTAIGVRPRKSLEAKGNKATTTDGYWRVRKGDIIVNKLLAWMGAMGVSEYDGVTSPAYDILRQTKHLQPKFYDFLFRCGIMFNEFRRYSRGIMDMRLRLYFDEFGKISIPYPPIQEQDEIIEFLKRELAQFEALNDGAQDAIKLLKERRSALIAAAVTGKIDVRGLAPC